MSMIPAYYLLLQESVNILHSLYPESYYTRYRTWRKRMSVFLLLEISLHEIRGSRRRFSRALQADTGMSWPSSSGKNFLRQIYQRIQDRKKDRC
ncbi:hypothetical protein NPIL_115461 [Nephila pilipes]|uniref:Uncharacterized protein n=1 Tax=Nephila pilipes TaxID=299642 RepID=A0A8X6U9X3_NEPPI|nr:hypothetical protein NPIL_115461 [Nephila pilipes]